MNPLLEQFLSEAREFLQGIGEKLMQLEDAPSDANLMVELFRLVHTLKGNSGLFEFPEMTRVLHAGEDLMDSVRNGRISYSQNLADELLDAMDFVGLLCDEIESDGRIDASRAADSARLAEALRALNVSPVAVNANAAAASPASVKVAANVAAMPAVSLPLADLPEPVRLEAWRRHMAGDTVYWITYTPVSECFFQGDDPFFNARQTPEVLWGRVSSSEAWPALAELDAYRCVLSFDILTAAPRRELDEHYRYVPDQVSMVAIDPWGLVIPQGNPNGGAVYEDFVGVALGHVEAGDFDALKLCAKTMLELSNPELWLSSALRWLLLLLDSVPPNDVAVRGVIESLRTLTPPDLLTASVSPALAVASVAALPVIAQVLATESTPALISAESLSSEVVTALAAIFAAQRDILLLSDQPEWKSGRVKAVAAVLVNCSQASGDAAAQSEIESALQQALATGSNASLLAWLDARVAVLPSATVPALVSEEAQPVTAPVVAAAAAVPENRAGEESPKFGRRAEDSSASANTGPKSLKVDQVKIDRLMNLIGEMVVSKNALPYLAQRAEEHFGVRELSREIRSQYAVINRIAEEMQDAIMQVRMMPVSFVFQRFPRLVRDISRKLSKEVQLVLIGEETEADKNIIEALADPLIHIVRNSLDHGLETPEVRRAAGKPVSGTLTIRAVQEGDQVLIEIIDDGKGINPAIVKQKAYEKGVIDEATLERISDKDAVNLVFAAGFSTAEVVSDLSGRGVGMDVVRTAVERVNGTIVLDSEVGKGTTIRISLPLSMAVTNLMIVESDGQIFGVPMDHVVETVRIPTSAIRTIKRSKTTVLRGNIVPLKSLNTLLAIDAEPLTNEDNEIAVLVARVGSDTVGLIVDEFHETVEVIQKPLDGVLAGLAAYSGSALMGDGSVLMVLNVREIV